MRPKFFKNTDELREWLKDNHSTQSELWVGYYKKRAKKHNFTWSESVDELLCYGWIDGLRKSIDSERYMIRITPRRRKSHWSKVNLEKIQKLIQNGKMQKPGLKAFSYYNVPK